MKVRRLVLPFVVLSSIGYIMVLQLGEQQSQQASTQRWGIHQSHATQHRNMVAMSSSVTIALNALANPIMAASSEQEETLQCVTYSGPCFFMNHPNGSTAPTRPVAAAKRPNATDEQPRLRPTPQPLRPFSLHNVTLLSGTRFHTAQRTNVEWLRTLEPDRMLYYFRNLSRLSSPMGLRPHGGWDGAGTGLRGHIVGHYLSAASMAAATTRDTILLRNLERITVGLEQCQHALGEQGYLSGFPQSEFAQMEAVPARPYAWVPYYVMHKLLAGLLDYHRLWGSRRALGVAIRLAEHLHTRVARMLTRGIGTWHNFINQEVGGMSEVLTDLSLVTGESRWLQLAAMFERPCFLRPLILAYQRRQRQRAHGNHTAGDRGDRGQDGRLAAAAIERMHGNTHLPQLLGAMARYEATGDSALRGAAEAFWRELRDGHQYVTGGSTVSETWRGAKTLGDPVSQRGRLSFGAHDHHETCVSHNSMRVSRRLLSWGEDGMSEDVIHHDGGWHEDDGGWHEDGMSEDVIHHDGGNSGKDSDSAGGAHGAHILHHSAYYERTMLNAVLGTQRGTLPGQMLYMYPMGGAVSKASYTSGSELHHWGDASTHWCCQGSGIEAFARLADSIFWQPDPDFVMRRLGEYGRTAAAAGVRTASTGADGANGADAAAQLFVLQSISSQLVWEEQHCTVRLEADTPGANAAETPLRTTIRVLSGLGGTATEGGPADASTSFVMWVRIPSWAQAVSARADGGLSLIQSPDELHADHPAFDRPRGSTRRVASGQLLPISVQGVGRLGLGSWLGSVQIQWSMAPRWEVIKDSRPQYQILQAPMMGPLVLAGFTHGERVLSANASLLPVPDLARRQLVSLQVPQATGVKSKASEDAAAGCLVTRWGHVWVLWTADRTRSFLLSPPATCVQRATPAGDAMNEWKQRTSGGAYRLNASASAQACAIYEGCLENGTSPFAAGLLVTMHNGTGQRIVLANSPPVVAGTRKGGTDAANAATWRIMPVDSDPSVVFIESFDSPGHVLSACERTGEVSLAPIRAEANSAKCEHGGNLLQRWHRRWQKDRVAFESADRAGKVLAVGDTEETLRAPLLHRGAFTSRTSRLMLASGDATLPAAQLLQSEAPAEYPAVALWASGSLESGGTSRSTYLLVPLNEVVDEHYTVYFCRMSYTTRHVPAFCL